MKWPILSGLFAGVTVGCACLLAGSSAPTLLLRLITSAAGIAACLCLRRAVFHRIRQDSYGSAGFAASSDIADLLVPENTRLTPGSILLGTTERGLLALPLELARQHGMIVGGSGTGKSFSYFLPNAAFAQNTSLVATDPKSELWKRTSGFHASTRYAPTDPDASACLNWIPLCSDARISELCARAIITAGGNSQDPPWQDLEAAFLASLFAHTATLSVPTPLTAYALLTNSDSETLVAQFLASTSQAAREQAVIFQQTHERMRGSITPVLAAKMQWLRDPAIQRFTSASLAPLDFGRLRRSVQAVFWCLEEQDIVRLRPLSSVFFTLLLEQLATESKSPAANVPIVCLLDEFANLGVLPNYASVISLSRGRGVALWHGVQSLSQLEASYGKATAQTILANCATKIVLSGADLDTADYFSRSLGPKTEAVPRRSVQRRRLALLPSGVSDTVQEHARPLLTADEIRRLPTMQALVLTGNRRPLILNKYRFALQPRTAATTALGAARYLPPPLPVRKPPMQVPLLDEDDLPPPPPPELERFFARKENEDAGTPQARAKPDGSKRTSTKRRRANTVWLRNSSG